MNRGLIGALCLSVAFALLTGCGGSEGQSIGVGAVRQAATRHRVIRPTTSNALVYAINGCGGICVLSYPDGLVVSKIILSGTRKGACSDSSGNVFVTNDTQVIEYSHGGTTPINILGLPGNSAIGCAVDPMTDNLAVAFSGTNVNVAVFPSASGVPTTYAAHADALYCGYDNAGNLFVSGSDSGVAELAYGSLTF